MSHKIDFLKSKSSISHKESQYTIGKKPTVLQEDETILNL